MKNIILFIGLFVHICTLSLFAQSDIVIFVQDVKNSSAAEHNWIADSLGDAMVADLSLLKNIVVITAESRRSAIDEAAFSQTGLADEGSVINPSDMKTANYSLQCTYYVQGSRLQGTALLTDIKKGSIYKSSRFSGPVNDIFKIQETIIPALLSETKKTRKADLKNVDEKAYRVDPSAYKLLQKARETIHEDPRKALGYVESAIAIDSTFIRAHMLASYITAFTLNKPRRGIEYVKRADTLYRKSGKSNTFPYAKVYMRYAQIYRLQKDWDASIRYLKLLKDHYEKFNLTGTFEYIFADSVMGHLYRKKKDKAGFKRHFHYAFKSIRSLDKDEQYKYAKVFASYSLSAFTVHMPEESLKYYPVALNYYKKYTAQLGNKDLDRSRKVLTERIDTISDYAYVLLRQGKPSESKKYLDQAEGIIISNNYESTYSRGKLFVFQGEYFMSRAKSSDSHRYYKKALQSFQSAQRTFKHIGYNKRYAKWANVRVRHISKKLEKQ